MNSFRIHEDGTLVFGPKKTGVVSVDALSKRVEINFDGNVVHFHCYDGFNYLPTEVYYAVRKTRLKCPFESFWTQKVVPALKSCDSKEEILALFSGSPHWTLEEDSRNFYESHPVEAFLGVFPESFAVTSNHGSLAQR